MLKKIALFLFILLPTSLFAEPTHFMEMHKEYYVVGITQIVEHAVLKQAYHGIIDGLNDEGYSEEKNLVVIYKSAKGDKKIAAQIAQEFVDKKVDLIMPISTPSAEAVVNADQNAKIPIVFTSVTDPLAAHLVPKLLQPGGHVTGVYDFPPVHQQIKLILDFMPKIKTIGILYTKDEINSVRMVEAFKKEAPPSLKIIEAEQAKDLVGQVEAIYVPADNTIVSRIDEVIKLTNSHRIPVFASEQGSVEKGALAAIAYDQYEVGYLAGRMAGKILQGTDPGKMDVVKLAEPQRYINASTAQQLKIKIP